MHTIYSFVSGPLVWIAFGLFIGGSCFKIASLIRLAVKKEKFIFSYLDLRYGLRSIGHWLLPFGTRSMRLHPAMTIVTFAFHICLLATPVFLSAHIVMLDESLNIRWAALPEGMADVMTLIVIFACFFFLYRRIIYPEVRYVTTFSDYILLAMVAAPFVTGLYAARLLPGHSTAVILHILSGEILLAAIPFTRLVHMLFSVFTRAYTGSEFGAVRHARDW